MSFLVTLMTVVQSHTISLGVGASTLAILNFFSAIRDGTISPTERRMMGIVYVVLRIAMVSILVTTLFLITADQASSTTGTLSTLAFGEITTLTILFLNAAMMSLKLMPSTFGPAIQAGSWYTMGTLAALYSVRLTEFSYIEFLLGYLTWLVLAIGIVNGTMALMKAQHDERAEKSTTPASDSYDEPTSPGLRR